LFLEILIVHDFANGHANVASRIERPALRFNLLECGGAAKAGHVSEFWFLAEHFLNLRAGFIAAVSEVQFFAAIEADDVGDKSNLRMRPIAMCAVNLPVDVAGILSE
jgi:hypothetical protein